MNGSQSPNSRVLNITNIQSNASASATTNGQQTFYMAERLKKNHAQITNAANGLLKGSHYRHGSVDDKLSSLGGSGAVIQSTNDSRVEEILPNVIPGGKQQR